MRRANRCRQCVFPVPPDGCATTARSGRRLSSAGDADHARQTGLLLMLNAAAPWLGDLTNDDDVTGTTAGSAIRHFHRRSQPAHWCLGLAVIGFAFFHDWCRYPPSVEPSIASAQVGPPPAESTPWKGAPAEPRGSRLRRELDNAGIVPQPKGKTICPWAHDRAVDGELPRDYSVNCPHWQRWTRDHA
jgi:hypothetical protein